VSSPASTAEQNSNTAIPVTLASFWKRLFAWIYDLLGALGIFILALALGQLFLFIVTKPWISDFSQFSQATSKSVFWGFYLFLCVQYYYVWCWVKGGQTVGMKAWKLQLYKTDGSLLSWREAYIRSFMSLGGISNLWCLIDSQKRGLHDLIFDTRVIELPKDFYKNQNQKPLI